MCSTLLILHGDPVDGQATWFTHVLRHDNGGQGKMSTGVRDLGPVHFSLDIICPVEHVLVGMAGHTVGLPEQHKYTVNKGNSAQHSQTSLWNNHVSLKYY